ncbi:DUF1963 domain-containing protein [Alisedimentitalea sp. MJ-SS2]|uniref:DUF1963 domain-containing protein n=1 Tax=Aliisedimentitalea sp. MJ-SS2 TaxID=3049795 RepID=UPI00291120BF|nr:DUF1963 domain-containing protein [Alisedimentitalea sp. MJ-SS2]MDU8929376.1 DUF1963 domain-containing protein [Alisedimentitalea sp. MJ-SS2]
MNAATFAPIHDHDLNQENLRLPAILAGLVLFAGGMITQQPWMSFLGVAAFLGTYMSATTTPQAGAADPARRVVFDGELVGEEIYAPVDITEILARANAAVADNSKTTPALRVLPIVPLRGGLEINSWLGGNPYLPQDVDWPVLDGEPALFLAQISLTHVPDDIWQGQGPRDGWLVMFASQSNLEHTHLLHTHCFGEERQAPGPLTYPDIVPKRADLLERAVGRPATIPRWPVEFCRQDNQETTPLDRPNKADSPLAPVQWVTGRIPLTDPGLVPFDWGSAMVLLEVATTDLEWQYRVVSTLVETGSDDPQALGFLETLRATTDNLHALHSELAQARDSGLPFDDQVCELMIRGLGVLQVESGENIEERDTDPGMQSLLDQDQIRRDYIHWLDQYARAIYSDRPDSLPPEHRDQFEELWAWHALHERGWIGGVIPGTFASASSHDAAERVALLRLQSSDLMGWGFGNQNEFCISIEVDDLARGDFSQTRGEVSGG